MSVFNTTTGLSASTGALQLIADHTGNFHSPSAFYDGSSAEWIDERPLLNMLQPPLRAQSPVDTTWGFLAANGAAPGSGSDLDVVPWQVADARHGCAADRGVVSVMVVDMEPAGKCSGALTV